MNVRHTRTRLRVSMRDNGTDMNRETFSDAVGRLLSQSSFAAGSVANAVLPEVEEVDIYVCPLVKQPKRSFAKQVTRSECLLTPRNIATSRPEHIRQDGSNSRAVRHVSDRPVHEQRGMVDTASRPIAVVRGCRISKGWVHHDDVCVGKPSRGIEGVADHYVGKRVNHHILVKGRTDSAAFGGQQDQSGP